MDWQIENKTFQIGSGTHWVCYQNVDRHQCEYFDPFGLIMPYDIKYYLKTSGKKLYIQQMKYKKEIVYYAFIGVYLYLLERQKSRSILNVIQYQIQFYRSNDKSQIFNKIFQKYIIYMNNGEIILWCVWPAANTL